MFGRSLVCNKKKMGLKIKPCCISYLIFNMDAENDLLVAFR